MAFWNNPPQAAQPEPKPETRTPEPDTAALEAARVRRLEDALTTLAESTAAQRQPVNQPQPAPQPQRAQIRDISDEELDRVYYDGDPAQIRKAEGIRRDAVAERIRREMDDKVNALQTAGVGAINDLTVRAHLGNHKYYSKDPVFKRDVDALVNQLKANGQMVTGEALQWIVNKVTGDHHERIVTEALEADTRQRREAPPAPTSRGGRTPEGRFTPGTNGDYGLPADAMTALQHLNRGRGRSPDEFAQELPQRRIRVTDVENGKFKQRLETRSYANFGEALNDREWADSELARQHAIMRGEISPLTPVTERSK